MCDRGCDGITLDEIERLDLLRGIRQMPGGFGARIALLNDLSNGQQRSSRARGFQSRRLTTLERWTGLLQLHQGAPPLSSLAAFDVVGSSCGRGSCPEPGDQRKDVSEHLLRYSERSSKEPGRIYYFVTGIPVVPL